MMDTSTSSIDICEVGEYFCRDWICFDSVFMVLYSDSIFLLVVVCIWLSFCSVVFCTYSCWFAN